MAQQKAELNSMLDSASLLDNDQADDFIAGSTASVAEDQTSTVKPAVQTPPKKRERVSKPKKVDVVDEDVVKTSLAMERDLHKTIKLLSTMQDVSLADYIIGSVTAKVEHDLKKYPQFATIFE